MQNGMEKCYMHIIEKKKIRFHKRKLLQAIMNYDVKPNGCAFRKFIREKTGLDINERTCTRAINGELIFAEKALLITKALGEAKELEKDLEYFKPKKIALYSNIIKLQDFTQDVTTNLVSDASMPKEYAVMAKEINKSLPAMIRDSSNFHKSHSQFMYSTLDVAQLTPIRSIKHTLAEVSRTKNALEANYIRVKKDEIKLLRLEKQRASEMHIMDKEELEVRILEKQINLNNAKESMQGAIRKFSFFTEQYKKLLASIGKTEEDGITEEEYEAEEEKYHIMTAMNQALTAARSRQGWIDEGNNIYIFQLGVNNAVAQKAVFAYLLKEKELLEKGKDPTARMTLEWLEECAERWKGCSKDIADWRGLQTFAKQSLHIGET